MVFVVLVVLLLVRLYSQLQKSFREPSVLLELTPPAFTQKTSYTTSRLFSALHNLGERRTLLDKLLGRKILISLEIVSTVDKGIRYVVRTTPKEVNNVKRIALSYLPQLQVRTVEDYVPDEISIKQLPHTKISEYKLGKHYALPLQKQNILEEHDPVAYLTGMMTKLSPGELIAFQIVLSPVNVREKQKISKMILRNEDVLGYLNTYQPSVWMKPVFFTFTLGIKLMNVLSHEMQWAVTELAHQNSNTGTVAYQSQIQSQMQPTNNKPARVLSSFEQEALLAVQEKVKQPLFEASVRVFVMMRDQETVVERSSGLTSALSILSVPEYQSLEEKGNFPSLIVDMMRFTTFKHRMLSFLLNSSSSLLSASEVSDLYHFPFSIVTQTENLVTAMSRELPAPLSQKQTPATLDLIIGKNSYGRETIPIGLPLRNRNLHVYLDGKTGMGKSTIIKHMVYQDICAGKGVCVIDPHGDMIKELLRVIPQNRRKDVVYVNPADKACPVGLNILSPGGTFTDPEEESERISGLVMSIFMKITPKHNWGQRMEHILRNATLTALQIPCPTPETPYRSLYTIQKLLTDSKYRTTVTSTLTDPVLKQFWKKEFSLYGSMQQASAISPLTNKLGEFITSKMSRNILLQEKSTISVSQIMDEGKILLCNLSKGELGEDRSSFFGILLVSLIQLAAYQRAQQPEEKRRDFFLYIDEFQNFATSTFADLLSEARKYRVFVTVANQNMAQIEDEKLSNVLLGNVGVIICLKNGPDDERILLPIFRPEVKEGDIVNLASHHFFMKITSASSEAAFSGETIPFKEEGSQDVLDEIIQHSRNLFTTPRAVVEKQLNVLFGIQEKTRIIEPIPVPRVVVHGDESIKKTNGKHGSKTIGKTKKKPEKISKKHELQ